MFLVILNIIETQLQVCQFIIFANFTHIKNMETQQDSFCLIFTWLKVNVILLSQQYNDQVLLI